MANDLNLALRHGLIFTVVHALGHLLLLAATLLCDHKTELFNTCWAGFEISEKGTVL